MTSTVCPACWTCCWTVNRLQIHLHQSRRHRNGCYERLTWLYEPLEVPAPIVETKQDDRHLRLPATVVPHVLSQTETQCETRLDADARWVQACHNEGLTDPIDEAWVNNCKMAFDAVLRDQSMQTVVDPDPILWRLTCLADGHGLPPATEGLGAWALAVWMHDDLHFSRFAHLPVEFFGRCLEAIRQIVSQSPVGKLVCWRRHMDGAFCPQDIVEKGAYKIWPRCVHGKSFWILFAISTLCFALSFNVLYMYLSAVEYLYVEKATGGSFGFSTFSVGAEGWEIVIGGLSTSGIICGRGSHHSHGFP